MTDKPEVADYLDHLAKERDVSPNTVLAYRRDLHDFVEFLAAPHCDRLRSAVAQRGQVLAGVALQRQHPDAHGAHRCSLGKRVSPSCMTAATISPYWLKILPWVSDRPPDADGEDWS